MPTGNAASSPARWHLHRNVLPARVLHGAAEDIQLAGTFVAVINAELKVGTVQETVTVTGESPIVDVQSVSRQTTLTNEVINSIPAVRSYARADEPDAEHGDAWWRGGQLAGAAMVVFGAAGGRANEGRLAGRWHQRRHGLQRRRRVRLRRRREQRPGEIVLTASGGMGEAEVGRPDAQHSSARGRQPALRTAVPGLVTPGMVGSNYTEELRARGLTTPGAFKNSGITTSASAGPSSEDRLWLARPASDGGLQEHVPGMFANANAGNPNSWTYAPDRSRPAYQAASFNIFALRLLHADQRPEQGQRLVGRAEALRRRGVHRRRRGVPSLRTGSNHLRRRIADAIMLGNGAPRTGAYRNLPAGAAGPLDVARDESLLLEAGWAAT